MMNKLSGQPDSYDKKYVESWPLSLCAYTHQTPELNIDSAGHWEQEHTG